MTVTVSDTHHADGWTIDDLQDTPDDGNRYEIVDGSLLATPPPNGSHVRVNTFVRNALLRGRPADLEVVDCAGGIDIRARTTCYIPDVMVVRTAALRRATDVFQPKDVLLVAEVLSPSNAGIDLVQKRHDYAAAGIPRYWIVDPQAKTITVLALPGGATVYKEEFVVRAGEPWQTDSPYPLTVDPAEIF
jgi:Uma2 family endonuclease